MSKSTFFHQVPYGQTFDKQNLRRFSRRGLIPERYSIRSDDFNIRVWAKGSGDQQLQLCLPYGIAGSNPVR